MLVDLGSDQTSCHNPFNGGYYPVQLSFSEANAMMVSDPNQFKCVSLFAILIYERQLVQESLRRQIAAINTLSDNGMKFWDYGNSLFDFPVPTFSISSLLEASRANAAVTKADGSFIYPSYVEDIMGDIFSLGFGPFRWYYAYLSSSHF